MERHFYELILAKMDYSQLR